MIRWLLSALGLLRYQKADCALLCDHCPTETRMTPIQPRNGAPKVWVCEECGYSVGGRQDELTREINRLRGEIMGLWLTADDPRPLHEALGMTREEFSAWGEKKAAKQ